MWLGGSSEYRTTLLWFLALARARVRVRVQVQEWLVVRVQEWLVVREVRSVWL